MPHHRAAHDRPQNLLPNPGFEEASPTEPLSPLGWIIDAPAPSTLVRTGRSPHTGRWALDAKLRFGPDAIGTVQLIAEDLVPIVGGARLVVGGNFLREHEVGPPDPSDLGACAWIAGRWLDTHGENARAVGHFLQMPDEPLPIGRFETRREIVVAPAEANALALIFVLVGGDASTGRTAPLVIDSVFAHQPGRVTQPAGTRTHADHTPGRHRGRQSSDPTALWFNAIAT